MPINILLVKEMQNKENKRNIENITDTLNSYQTYEEQFQINELKQKYDQDINVFQQNILYEYNDNFFVPNNNLQRYLQLKDTIEFLKDNIEDYNLDFIHFQYKQDEYLNPLQRLQYDQLSTDIIVNSTNILQDLNQNIDFSTFDLTNININKQQYLNLYKDLEKYMLDNKIYQRLLTDVNADIKYYEEYINSFEMYFVEYNSMEQYYINQGNLEKQYIEDKYGYYNFLQNETVNIYFNINKVYIHTNYQLLTLEDKLDNFQNNHETFVQNDFNLLNINYCYDISDNNYSLYVNLKDNLNFLYDNQLSNVIGITNDLKQLDLQQLEKNKISYMYKNGSNINYKISYNHFIPNIKHRYFVYTLNHMFKNQRQIVNDESLLGQVNYNKSDIQNKFQTFLDDMVQKSLILDYDIKITRIEDNLKFEVIMYSNRLDNKMYKAEN